MELSPTNLFLISKLNPKPSPVARDIVKKIDRRLKKKQKKTEMDDIYDRIE